MAARLEHLAWTWRQGAPVRVGELQALLVDVRDLAAQTEVPELHRLASRIEALITALGAARARAEHELSAIPGRKRAMRAHARANEAPAIPHFRKRA